MSENVMMIVLRLIHIIAQQLMFHRNCNWEHLHQAIRFLADGYEPTTTGRAGRNFQVKS